MVVIDFDGVLFNYHAAMRAYLKDKYDIEYEPELVRSYDFDGVSDEVKSYIWANLWDPSVYKYGVLEEKVVDVVKDLVDIGEEVVISTLCNTMELAQAKWEVLKPLRINGVEFDFQVGDSKRPIQGASAVFEDSENNLFRYGVGVEKYVIAAPYNKDTVLPRYESIVEAINDYASKRG